MTEMNVDIGLNNQPRVNEIQPWLWALEEKHQRSSHGHRRARAIGQCGKEMVGRRPTIPTGRTTSAAIRAIQPHKRSARNRAQCDNKWPGPVSPPSACQHRLPGELAVREHLGKLYVDGQVGHGALNNNQPPTPTRRMPLLTPPPFPPRRSTPLTRRTHSSRRKRRIIFWGAVALVWFDGSPTAPLATSWPLRCAVPDCPCLATLEPSYSVLGPVFSLIPNFKRSSCGTP
jgi:hypothetical protein